MNSRSRKTSPSRRKPAGDSPSPIVQKSIGSERRLPQNFRAPFMGNEAKAQLFPWGIEPQLAVSGREGLQDPQGVFGLRELDELERFEHENAGADL